MSLQNSDPPITDDGLDAVLKRLDEVEEHLTAIRRWAIALSQEVEE